jgi:acyl dehydratase
MYLAGLLATAVTNWIGIGSLRSYQVRFMSKAWPGDVLCSRLQVTDVRLRDAALRVEIDCRLVDPAGEARIQGLAIADVGGTSGPTPTAGGPA